MRVVAGSLKGRKLTAVHGLMTRPTADRVREALFSILGRLDGARVLDLYAGTGALGIEAISRGADHAVFVESARAALVAIHMNVTDLGLTSRTTTITSDVERAARSIVGPFDVVFVDPPYEVLAVATKAVAAFAQSPTFLTEDGIVVVEHGGRSPAVIEGLVAYDTRKYGSTALTFFSRPRVDAPQA